MEYFLIVFQSDINKIKHFIHTASVVASLLSYFSNFLIRGVRFYTHLNKQLLKGEAFLFWSRPFLRLASSKIDGSLWRAAITAPETTQTGSDWTKPNHFTRPITSTITTATTGGGRTTVSQVRSCNRNMTVCCCTCFLCAVKPLKVIFHIDLIYSQSWTLPLLTFVDEVVWLTSTATDIHHSLNQNRCRQMENSCHDT